jgi:hypothetical protein
MRTVMTTAPTYIERVVRSMKSSTKTHASSPAIFALALLVWLGGLVTFAVPFANAQYFSVRTVEQQNKILEANGLDSVLFVAATPFALPKTPDSVNLTYHEPMPDSIMPRSAIVVGTITIQAEEPDQLVSKLEKMSRKMGADWIVSFAEPRAFRDRKGNRLFRSSALLLHVLDPMFTDMNAIEYSYYEANGLHTYAAVSNWFDSFGRHFGARIDKAE